VFALRQALDLYDFHRTKVDECDVEIEAALTELNNDREVPAAPMPEVRHARNRNEPKFELRAALYTLAKVRGTFWYLYAIIDVWSRKIVGWRVHEVQSDALARSLSMMPVGGKASAAISSCCTRTTALR
jgi:transposase InsO family protein